MTFDQSQPTVANSAELALEQNQHSPFRLFKTSETEFSVTHTESILHAKRY